MGKEVVLWSGLTHGALMFVFALIFLGLLALIPALKKPYGVRHALAWLLGSLAIGWVVADRVPFAPLALGSVVCGALMAARYWWTMRKARETSEVAGKE